MRIVWITSEYFPRVGGLEQYVEEFLDALSNLCCVGIITGEGQSLRPHQQFAHVGALNLVRPSSQDEFEHNGAMLLRLVKEFRADVVHLASAGLACYAPVLAAELPVFASVHCKDLTRPWQTLPGQDISAAIAEGLRLCRMVFCVSTYTRAHVAHRSPSARSVLLTPGLNIGQWHSLPERTETDETGDPMILTVARLIPRKGHLALLEALESVRLPFQWHIVGTGPMKDELAERIAASPIRDRAHMHGLVSNEALCDLYQRCAFFALTPVVVFDSQGIDAEGFGLVYLEAATYGKPSIASDSSGCAEAVLDGNTGLLIKVEDPTTVTAALEKLLTSPSLCRELGVTARERVLRDFRWSDRVECLLQEYGAAYAAGGRR